MKLKWNLSLTAKSTQRCAQTGKMAAPIFTAPAPAAAGCTVRKNASFDLLTARAKKPVRIPPPIISARPVFRGDKSYLRALRAAEMALWNANLKFPAF